MNREFVVVGMMEYGGLGLMVVVGLFVAALDLMRALLLLPHNPGRVLHQRRISQKTFPQSKQSQINQ